MSRLGCKCGAVMTYTDCPSPCIMKIYLKSDIDRAIESNPSIRWINFENGWDEINQRKKEYSSLPYPAEYWFCPECKRVYVIDLRYNRWTRVYKPDDTVQQHDITGWREVGSFHVVETDEATEADMDLSVKDFVYNESHPRKVYLSSDLMRVMVYDGSSGNSKISYTLEERWTPEI